MPHVDDHTLRSAHSPHPPHLPPHVPPHPEDSRAPAAASRHHPSYYYDKRPSEAEMSPRVTRQASYSPSPPGHWRHPPHPHHHHSPRRVEHEDMDSTGGSRGSIMAPPSSHSHTPPASPHMVPPPYEYTSAYPESYYPSPRGGPPMSPYSQRGRGGYSYYHHHPNSRPPMMPPDMHYHHHYHPEMSPPPPYHHSYLPPPPPHPHSMPSPRFETPPLTASPSSTTSYYHDQQYPNFLPPSASMGTTASSASANSTMSPREGAGGDEEYFYGGGGGEPHHTGSSSASPGSEVNQVGPNDVLCGRGAPTNYHPGNEFFRDLVKEYQGTYLSSKRADKPFVATHIVNIVQSRGGRFLRRYKRNGVSWERGHFVWVEVDPQKAYEKACQALREGAPELRRKMAGSGSTDEDDEDTTTSTTAKDLKKAPSSPSATMNKTQRDTPITTGGERIQEEVEEKKEEDGPSGSTSADASNKEPAAQEPSADDRNDDMQDSERS